MADNAAAVDVMKLHLIAVFGHEEAAQGPLQELTRAATLYQETTRLEENTITDKRQRYTALGNLAAVGNIAIREQSFQLQDVQNQLGAPPTDEAEGLKTSAISKQQELNTLTASRTAELVEVNQRVTDQNMLQAVRQAQEQSRALRQSLSERNQSCAVCKDRKSRQERLKETGRVIGVEMTRKDLDKLKEGGTVANGTLQKDVVLSGGVFVPKGARLADREVVLLDTQELPKSFSCLQDNYPPDEGFTVKVLFTPEFDEVQFHKECRSNAGQIGELSRVEVALRTDRRVAGELWACKTLEDKFQLGAKDKALETEAGNANHIFNSFNSSNTAIKGAGTKLQTDSAALKKRTQGEIAMVKELIKKCTAKKGEKHRDFLNARNKAQASLRQHLKDNHAMEVDRGEKQILTMQLECLNDWLQELETRAEELTPSMTDADRQVSALMTLHEQKKAEVLEAFTGANSTIEEQRQAQKEVVCNNAEAASILLDRVGSEVASQARRAGFKIERVNMMIKQLEEKDEADLTQKEIDSLDTNREKLTQLHNRKRALERENAAVKRLQEQLKSRLSAVGGEGTQVDCFCNMEELFKQFVDPAESGPEDTDAWNSSKIVLSQETSEQVEALTQKTDEQERVIEQLKAKLFKKELQSSSSSKQDMEKEEMMKAMQAQMQAMQKQLEAMQQPQAKGK